jgi:hypothetical protein
VKEERFATAAGVDIKAEHDHHDDVSDNKCCDEQPWFEQRDSRMICRTKGESRSNVGDNFAIKTAESRTQIEDIQVFFFSEPILRTDPKKEANERRQNRSSF